MARHGYFAVARLLSWPGSVVAQRTDLVVAGWPGLAARQSPDSIVAHWLGSVVVQ